MTLCRGCMRFVMSGYLLSSFNDIFHKLYYVEKIKWIYERYPARYFDDPCYSCTSLNQTDKLSDFIV